MDGRGRIRSDDDVAIERERGRERERERERFFFASQAGGARTINFYAGFPLRSGNGIVETIEPERFLGTRSNLRFRDLSNLKKANCAQNWVN